MQKDGFHPSDLRLGWFHRYPARFPIEAVSMIFKTIKTHFGNENPKIIDPFSGTGTTLSAARQLGMESIGIELSRLGVLISKVRTLHPAYLSSALTQVENMISGSSINPHTQLNPELVKWIGIRNSRSLISYKNFMVGIDDSSLRACVELAISSAIRPASCWLTGSIKPQRDPNREPPDIGPQVLQSVRKLKRDNETEYCNGPIPLILKGDARSVSLASASIDAVVTSPPYGTTYDYFDVQRLSYLALDWPWEATMQIGRSSRIPLDGKNFTPPIAMANWYEEEYRGEATAKGRALRAYFVDMKRHLKEMYRILKPGGIIAYALANSYRKQKTFDLIGSVMELISDLGFHDMFTVKRIIDDRRILPAGRDPSSGRFSSSHRGFPVDEQIIYAFK